METLEKAYQTVGQAVAEGRMIKGKFSGVPNISVAELFTLQKDTLRSIYKELKSVLQKEEQDDDLFKTKSKITSVVTKDISLIEAVVEIILHKEEQQKKAAKEKAEKQKAIEAKTQLLIALEAKRIEKQISDAASGDLDKEIEKLKQEISEE